MAASRGRPCCNAANRPISGVPSLGVSSLDLGPHGNSVAALFFARPPQIARLVQPALRRWVSIVQPPISNETAQNCDENVTCPCFEHTCGTVFQDRPCRDTISGIPRSCPTWGVSSLDLGRRHLPSGPFFRAGCPGNRSNFSSLFPTGVHAKYIPGRVGPTAMPLGMASPP